MGIDRRRFLAGSSALLGATAARRLAALGVPAVEAIPTIFHGHPDGTRTLVRFLVRNSDAPAGRMRVYDDRTNALLGTAGVLPAGDRRLIGELWIPLLRPLRIRTEFEYPGTQRPLRDRFSLNPTPRWTLHWLLLADAAAVAARVARVDPLWRGVATAVLSRAGVQLDPVRTADPATDLTAARIAWPARQINRSTGVPLSPLGTALRGFAALPGVMRDSGLIGTVGMIDEPWTLVDAVPPTLSALQRLVEERLVVEDAVPQRGIVIVPVADRAPAPSDLFDAWTQRFAAPVITIGTAPTDLRSRAINIPHPPLPAGARGLAERAAARCPVAAAEAGDAFRPLARRVGRADDPFSTIAQALNYPLPGLVVFNHTPWGRTDSVQVPGGGERIATNVPAYGYALLPAADGATWPEPTPVGSMATIANETWRLRVDGAGTIASLVHVPSDTELAGPGGLCAVPGARADAFALSRSTALGERLTFQSSGDGLTWQTTVTLLDGVSSVDIATTGGPWDGIRTFDPAVGGRRTRWAVPLGEEVMDGSGGPATVRTWCAADGDAGSLMIATPEGAIVRRDGEGTMHLTCPEGPVTLRLAFARPALPEDPWRVGSLGTPFTARAAPGTGHAALPSFGGMLDVRDPAVRVLGIMPASDGVGTLAYFHDLMGLERPVPVRGGLLPFTSAFRCDLLERDLEPLSVVNGTVMLPIPAGGVAALRILGG